jgi:hypothetical protein
MKLEVLLLLRNTLITRLSSKESAFELALEGNILYTVIGLQKHYQPTFYELA